MGRTNFWLINSWIIVALLLIVFILYSIGFLETFSHAKVECNLGEGIECLETYIYTNEILGASKGGKEDEITFFITNNLELSINNFSVMLPNCAGSKTIKNIESSETILYNVTKCKNLKVNGFFRSELLIRYDIYQNKKSFSMMSTGYMSNYVNSAQIERVDKTAKRNIFSWINKNIG